MRVTVVLKFARVLMISRLRSTRRSFVSRSLTSRPLLILILGTAAFIFALLAGVATTLFLRARVFTPLEVEQFVTTVLGGAPLFLLGFYFTMGLLWELNASTEAESTDVVNWLPITPAEYVAASSMATVYTYSPAIMMAWGYSLPVALSSNNLSAFLLLVPVALLSATIGSLGVEILRSGLARASVAFGRIGGRAMILMRILGIMLILLLTQILFSGFIIAQIIGSLVGGADIAGYAPFLWPTLAVTKALTRDITSSIIFFALGAVFLAGLVWVALSLRAEYWVVSPASLHVSSGRSISRPGSLGKIGFGQASIALLRREIRAATRRKEVTRLMVIPIIIPVMIGFPFVFSPAPVADSSSGGGLVSAALGGPFLFGVGLGSLILAMTSLGQEGTTLWNLGALPIAAPMLIRAKIFFAVIVSSIGLVLGALVNLLLRGFSLYGLAAFLLLGLTLIFVESSLGLAIGTRFPDFAEGPRPRFVTVTGTIVGTVVGILVMGVVLSPIGIALVLRFVYGIPLGLSQALALTVALGTLLAWAFYRLAIRPVQNFLDDLPA